MLRRFSFEHLRPNDMQKFAGSLAAAGAIMFIPTLAAPEMGLEIPYGQVLQVSGEVLLGGAVAIGAMDHHSHHQQ